MMEFLKSLVSGIAKFGRILVQGGLGVAVFSIFWFLIGALGTKFGFWDYRFGLMTMTFEWGRNFVFLAAGLSAIGIVFSLFASPRVKPFIVGLAGVLISSLIIGRLIGFGQEVMRLPPIHDIQTDWNDPIRFSDKLMAIRGEKSNPVEDAPRISEVANDRWPGYGGRLVSEVQEEAEWQDISSLSFSDGSILSWVRHKEENFRNSSKKSRNTPYPYILDSKYIQKPVEDVYKTALRTAKAQGWKIVTENPKSGIIEATDSTSWFGFEDDISIRIMEAPNFAMPSLLAGISYEEGEFPEEFRDPVKIDVRSVSRVGLSDIGTNAKRVNEFLLDLERASR